MTKIFLTGDLTFMGRSSVLLTRFFGPLLACIGGIYATDLRPSRIRNVLLAGDSDLLQVYAMTDIANGPFLMHSNEYGYPDGTNFHLQYVESDLVISILWALRVIVRSPIFAVNLYIVLSFGLAYIAFYWMSKPIILSQLIRFTLSLSFAWLPATFIRLTYGHVFLSSTWMVALALGLLIRWSRDQPLTKLKRSVFYFGAIGIGLGTPYYAFFSACFCMLLIFLPPTGNTQAHLFFRLKTLFLALLMVLPGLLKVAVTGFWIEERIVRTAQSSLAYPGQLYTLLTPIGFPYLAPDVLVQPQAEWVPSSLVMVLGLLLALRPVGTERHSDRFMRGGLLLGTMIFVSGGLGFIFASTVSPSLRVWVRIGPFIAALSLVIFGYFLSESLFSKIHKRWHLLTHLLLLLIVFAQVFDGKQLTGGRFDEASANEFQEPYERSLASLEKVVGVGCPVLVLPIMQLPEGGSVGGVGNGDHLMPALLSSEFFWSYGGIKGTRFDDWITSASQGDYEDLAAEARAVGMCAVWIDTRAETAGRYTDPGEWERLGVEYVGQFGPHVLLKF